MDSDFPPEMLTFILNKCDAKTLCVSSLASKDVADMISQSKNITLRLPAVDQDSVPNWPSGMLDFLRRFSCLETVTIDFTQDADVSQSHPPLLRWFCSNSLFFFLHAKRVLSSKIFKDFSLDVEQDISQELSSTLDRLMNSHLHLAKLYLLYVQDIVNIVPDLKTVTVQDNAGRLFVQEDDVAKGRFIISAPLLDETVSPSCLASMVLRWWAPMLTVPGFMLEEVTAVTSFTTSESRDPMPKMFPEEIWNKLFEVMTKEKPTEFIGKLSEKFKFQPNHPHHSAVA